jgi:hypothetical protein
MRPGLKSAPLKALDFSGMLVAIINASPKTPTAENTFLLNTFFKIIVF